MGKLKIGRFLLGICQTNCYFVYREGCGDVIFFDPADRGQYIYEALKEKGFQVKGIVLTHGHFDHILGAQKLKELAEADQGVQIPVYALAEEKELCMNEELNLAAQMGTAGKVMPDILLHDQEQAAIAGMTFKVIATPGHTTGSCCYYFAEDAMLISGDTLFYGSVGRTDFPTGSMGTLVRSIKDKLFCLPDEVKVYPGHGESTDIGFEKENNPFCR